jgi:peptidoglycan/xylan/chitin deacetylase (PgdA/CDA1 family)
MNTKLLSMIRSLPVLMYHSISRAQASTAVAPELFAEHCAALADAGWRALSLQEAETCFLEQAPFPPRSCLITFDDGYLDNWLNAAPLLERYGLRGAIFPVLSELEEAAAPRGPESASSPEAIVLRKGQKVRAERFCSVAELREMARRGILTPAPHSLRHDRVPAGPAFRGLARPGGTRGWFSLPAYGAVWGMPGFKQGHSLTTQAFLPSRRLLNLARRTVPQEFDEAKKYLSVPRNRARLLKRIRYLEAKELLGRMESIEEYRSRLFKEFTVCRKRFARLFGVAPVSFCWPWGDYNDMALEEAQRAGFRVFFTTGLGANSPASGLRIRRFKVLEISGARLLWETRLLSFALLANLAGRWQSGVAA